MHQTAPSNTSTERQSKEACAERVSNFEILPDAALIRLKDLLEYNVIPFSATTIWRKVRAGTFPQPEKISSNIVAWRCRGIREWLQNPASYMAEP
jgi:predicted DNA-binding transcriptional regulator AlpA